MNVSESNTLLKFIFFQTLLHFNSNCVKMYIQSFFSNNMIHFTPFEKSFLTIGTLKLNYYGLMYALGAVLIYLIIKKLFKKEKIKISNEQILDLISFGIFGVILGGRLGYVLFYNFNYYFENPLKILAIWEGGMSFHGGLIGVILAELIFCKKNKFNFYELADIVMIPVFIGLALGRIGNFINGELVGRITTLPWGMEFEGYQGLRHPSQLYESAKNIFIFGILFYLLKYRKKLRFGSLFWLGITFYGFFRFLIEFVREPDIQIGLILNFATLGQMLSLPMFLMGGGIFIYLNRKIKKSV